MARTTKTPAAKSTNGAAKTNSAIKQVEKDLAQAGMDAARTIARYGDDEPYHIYTGLLNEDVFFAGHRFHVVGTITRIDFDKRGMPIIEMNNTHQISYDEEEDIPRMYYLGNELRFPVESLGWMVQPVRGRPKGWREAWTKAKKAGAKRK